MADTTCEPWVVQLDEQTLRMKLSGPDGRGCGFQILNTVLKGEPLTVRLSNGEERRCSDIADAMGRLREFGSPSAPPRQGNPYASTTRQAPS
jgi:hypothetical protein